MIISPLAVICHCHVHALSFSVSVSVFFTLIYAPSSPLPSSPLLSSPPPKDPCHFLQVGHLTTHTHTLNTAQGTVCEFGGCHVKLMHNLSVNDLKWVRMVLNVC